MQKFDEFKKVKVLIVGDIMLDQYWWGNVSRISPEAPVPVVALDKKSVVAGGAANVAANVKGLDAIPILIGITGDDKEAQELRDSLTNNGISTDNLLKIKQRQTTVKTRVLASNQQVVRVDQEESSPISGDIEKLVWSKIKSVLTEVDIVLISDYAKGIITDNLATQIINYAKDNDLLVLVDPKGRDYNKYKHASILTPNEKEAFEASGVLFDDEDSIISAGETLFENLFLGHLLITRGKKGMTLFSANSQSIDLSTKARRVYDVTGAGDTVISTLAVALGSGLGFVEACELANEAAGIVVEKVGTSPISLNELKNKYV